MEDIIHKEESFSIMGACYNVYNDKGKGFLEMSKVECDGAGGEFEA